MGRTRTKLPPLLRATVSLFEKVEKNGLSGISNMIPEITYNNQRTYRSGKKAPDGIEIRFGSARPTEKVRELLKKYGFKFSEKQKIWYALDDETTRKFIAEFGSKELEVDTTVYEKLSFWAKVKSYAEYRKFYNSTEFFVKDEASNEALFYNNKRQLEKSHNPERLIGDKRLSFKKFYNKPVDETGEGDPESEAEDEGETDESGESEESENPDSELVEKLRSIADGMEKEIQKKLNPPISRQRPTARRQRITDSIRAEGFMLQDTQTLLYALANAYEDEMMDGYFLLERIRSKKEAALFLTYRNGYGKNEPSSWQFDNRKTEFDKIGITSLENWKEAIKQADHLIEIHSEGFSQSKNEQERKIQEAESKLVGKKIPGFFPTPAALIEKMIRLADLKPGITVLDPSAGKGDILDAVKRHLVGENPTLAAIEIQYELREVLKLKGHLVIGNDFMEGEYPGFDRIMMNPPFENSQDAEHVQRAFTLLNHGGRLVAIVSEGPFFRQFKKDRVFREFLKQTDADVSEPIEAAFKNGFNQTGVRVRIVTIEKTAVTAKRQTMPPDQQSDLEMEAEAELEILKLRVELLRKKKEKGLSGIQHINRKKLLELEGLIWENQSMWEVLNYK